MAGALASVSSKKEYEQDFEIKQLQRDIEKISKNIDTLSTSITEVKINIAELRANIDTKILEMKTDLDSKMKDRINENLWKSLIGTGLLLSIFKYFS